MSLHYTDRKTRIVLDVQELQYHSRVGKGFGYSFVQVKLETAAVSIDFATDESWYEFTEHMREAMKRNAVEGVEVRAAQK